MQQAPFWHIVVPAGQVSPQPPQLLISPLLVLTQVVPQHVSPAAQPVILQLVEFGWQMPETQEKLAPHTLLHVPQLFGSVLVFVSQPSATCPSQSSKPGLQATMPQAEYTQPVTPCGTAAQTMPQPPQLLLSALALAHVAPQHTWLEGQVWLAPQLPTHTPPEHESPVGHALEQLPQLFQSLPMLVSQPFDRMWSQSAKPGLHPPRAHEPL